MNRHERRAIHSQICIEIEKIGEVCGHSLRFGQIIGNVLPDRFQNDPYNLNDEELLAALTTYRRRLQIENDF